MKSFFAFLILALLLVLPSLAEQTLVIKPHLNQPVKIEALDIRVTLIKVSVDYLETSGGELNEVIWGALLFEKGKKTKKIFFDGPQDLFSVFDHKMSVTAVTRDWIELTIPLPATNP